MADDLKDYNLSAIAREQNVERATISARIARGWSPEEVLQGHRKDRVAKKREPYRYKKQLGGRTATAVAAFNKITVAALYYRLKKGLEFDLPPE